MSATPSVEDKVYDAGQEPRISMDESLSSTLDDDKVLQDLGYVPSFKREFSNLATVSISSTPYVPLW